MLLKAKFLQLAENQQLFSIHFQGVTAIQTLYIKIKQAVPAPGILLQILSEIHWQQIKLSECFCKPLERNCYSQGNAEFLRF